MKNTGAHTATLIARTCRVLGDIAAADGAGPIDQFGMAVAAYEAIMDEKVDDDTIRLALAIAGARSPAVSRDASQTRGAE